MSTIQVTTGYGYFKDDQDRVCQKAQLPIGEHNVDDSLNWTYHEAADQAELDAVAVDPDALKDPDWVP